MTKQHKLTLALVLSLLTFTGQTGLAMAKITCFCLNKTAWTWQWDSSACPFETEDETTASCTAEKSCCADSDSCTTDAGSCNDECLKVDMTWFNADLEAPSIAIAGMQDISSGSDVTNYNIWFSTQQIFSFSGQFNLPPPHTLFAKYSTTNQQALLCTWLC